MKPRARRTVAIPAVLTASFLTAFLSAAANAYADVRRTGDTLVAVTKKPLPPFGLSTRYPDVAYDPGHEVYLVITGQQPIDGRFVNAAGQPIGGQFRVSPSGNVVASRLDFSPTAGTFVATWVDEAGAGKFDDVITMRLLRFDGAGPAFVSGEIPIAQNGVPKHLDSAPAIACATGVTECLITWAQEGAGPWDIWGQRIDPGSGALLGAAFAIGTGPNWDAHPSVAYNSQQHEYFVVHTSEPNGVMHTVGERIQAGTGAHLGRSTLYSSVYTNYAEVAYNSRGNVYVVISYHAIVHEGNVIGALISGDGTPLTPIIPVTSSPQFEGGDGMGLAYNAAHDAFFAVFQGPTHDTHGIEINGVGTPGVPFRVMTSGSVEDIYQPQIAPATNAARYLIAASIDHNRVSTQLMDATPADGGGGGGDGGGGGGGDGGGDPVVIRLDTAPNGSWFFAEGTAGSGAPGFNTFYLIANEHPEPVHVRAYLSNESGQAKELNFSVPAHSRTTLDLAQAVGQGSFGAVFQSLTAGKDVFVERSVYWGPNFEGSASEVAVKDPSHAWYFAEGSCGCAFYANFFLLFNPTQTAAHVTATYARDDGTPVTRSYAIAPQSRLTIFANEIAELTNHNFGTTFASSQPIVAERAIYWGPGWIGGTATIGAKAPSQEWFFAEGAASPGFDTFYLLLNPDTTATDVQMLFTLPDGQAFSRVYTVAAGSRANVWLNETLGQTGAVSARFWSPRPIIVERSIYWGWQDGLGWREGTSSVGVSRIGSEWHVPEGATTGLFEDFLLVHNPNDGPVALNITVYTEQFPGQPQTLVRTVPGRGRETIYMHALLAELGFPPHAAFATRVAAQDGWPVVVEHAQYWQNLGGGYWRSGSSAFGVQR